MKKRISYFIIGFFCLSFLLCLIMPKKEYSNIERRKLASFPEVSYKTLLSGEFMDEFEEYAADHFPFREQLRSIKTAFSTYIMGQKDSDGFYMAEGHIGKMDYPLQEASFERAVSRISYVYEKYIKGTEAKAYFSLIPDKNYYLAEKNGFLSYDYEEVSSYIKSGLKDMTHIDIMPLLSEDDYYKTDPHWKQENLIPVAEKLAGVMGTSITGKYDRKSLETPFYGTYYGQMGLPAQADEITYLTNPVLESCIVTNYETGKQTGVYDLSKASGDDPYEIFLSGPVSLLTIDNPEINSKKELVVFRDSFGSSLVPLLAEGYRRVTLVDIRYMHPDQLARYVDFKDQDVLFLYCTSVLNHSETIK